MSQIHLSLVGAQPIPVYNGIKDADAEYIFLLHSKNTKQVADNIASNWKGGLNLILVEKPFEYDYCKKLIEKLLANFPDGVFSFNITGGTKIMTLAAYDVAKENNISTIYIDQNNKLTDLSSNQHFFFRNTIELPVYFKLYGQQVKQTTMYNHIDPGLFEMKTRSGKTLKTCKPYLKNIEQKNTHQTIRLPYKTTNLN